MYMYVGVQDTVSAIIFGSLSLQSGELDCLFLASCVGKQSCLPQRPAYGSSRRWRQQIVVSARGRESAMVGGDANEPFS